MLCIKQVMDHGRKKKVYRVSSHQRHYRTRAMNSWDKQDMTVDKGLDMWLFTKVWPIQIGDKWVCFK